MIEFSCTPEIVDLVAYLNYDYPASKIATLVVVPGYDIVWDGQGGVGFAAYDPEDRVLWVAGEPPEIEDAEPEELERFVLENTVHEYIHHFQNCEGRDFGEYEAERRTHEIVTAFLNDRSTRRKPA